MSGDDNHKESRKMSVKFKIPPDQVPDLAVIRDFGSEELQRIGEHLNVLTRQLPLTVVELQRIIVQFLGGKQKETAALTRQLLALNQLVRQRELSVDEVMESLHDGIGRLEGWSAAEKDAWYTIEPPLATLFGTAAIRSVSKANDLAYDHANLFQSARIVTDIRPVFNDLDDDGMDIDGAVVSYTLRLHFDNREGDHSLSVALDEVDIIAIRAQCERALHKARVAKTRMAQDTGLHTVISGDDDNASH